MPLRLGYMSPSEQQMGDVSVQGSSGHDVIVTASMCSGSDFPVPSASPPAARQGSSRESCARPSAALLEIEQHVDVGGLRRMPAWGAFCNNVAFMAVPRSIPACFKATGWSLGIASLTYSTVVTFDTGVVLGDLCLQEPALTSFPLLAGEAMARVSSEANAPRARAFGYLSVQGLQFSTYYLTAVAELIYFEQYFGQLFDSSALCQWQWLLLVGVICVPVMQVPSFHETRWAAVLLGLLPLAFNVCVFFVEVAAVRPWDCVPGPSFEQPGGRSVFLGFSAFAYAFGGHGLYPEEVREMKRPSSWRAVIAATYAVTVPMYWACGLVGYAAYGDYAQANINLNFPPNTLNRVSIGVQLAQEVFFVLESNLVRPPHPIPSRFLPIPSRFHPLPSRPHPTPPHPTPPRPRVQPREHAPTAPTARSARARVAPARHLPHRPASHTQPRARARCGAGAGACHRAVARRRPFARVLSSGARRAALARAAGAAHALSLDAGLHRAAPARRPGGHSSRAAGAHRRGRHGRFHLLLALHAPGRPLARASVPRAQGLVRCKHPHRRRALPRGRVVFRWRPGRRVIGRFCWRLQAALSVRPFVRGRPVLCQRAAAVPQPNRRTLNGDSLL